MLLEDVRKNKTKTFFIVTLFFTLVSIILYFAVYYFSEGSFIALPIAFLFSFFTSFISYYNSDKIILKLNKARLANTNEDRQINSILEGLCIATNMKKPTLYVIDDTAINAFATGRNPDNAVICLTTGTISRLDKYELEGVIAHELSHIKNYDILLQTVVTVMVGFIVILSDFATRSMIHKDNDNKNPIILIVGILLLILAPVFMKLMQLALSRNREYLADATAADITRNPKGLMNALQKIKDDTEIVDVANKSSAHLYIANPFKKKELFSTHPDINDRIARLANIK